MFGDGRVQLKKVRGRQVSEEEPGRAENPNTTSRPFSRSSNDQRNRDDKAKDREIFHADLLTPAGAVLQTLRIEDGTFHVQVRRPNHKPDVIAQGRRHQRGPHRRRPASCGCNCRNALFWQLAQERVPAHDQQARHKSRNSYAARSRLVENEEVRQKHCYPETGALARAKRQKKKKGGQNEKTAANEGSRGFPAAKVQ